ncbi:sensor histidine kinase [Paenibacillus contaminans]|uniref:HAMP domain-containing protein n=1 Tax=Paenibacillus contaminans TaxID=450362 RepID=A0A329LY64_9BACL|nr:sensor histidine kinase [Paenibacillus contaminans]RAV12182.1 hypothetical protein DQG23_35265 [Paenibacillus contaminans]
MNTMPAWYDKAFKQKFFNRLLLSYTLIILITIVSLTVTIIRNMVDSAEQEASNSVNKTAQMLNHYIEQKVNTVKLLVKQLYLNPVQSQDMLEFLSTQSEDYTSDDLYKANLIKYYLNSSAFQDVDILDAVIYKKATGSLYMHSNDSTPNTDEYLDNNRGFFGRMDDRFHGLAVSPSYLQTYAASKQKRIFSIAANIRGGTLSTNFDKSIAILSINFDTSRISEYINSQIDASGKAEILVLTDDGDVMIDTEDRYYGQKYPYFDQVKQSGLRMMLDEQSMVSVTRSDDLGFYVVSKLPYSEIAAKTRSSRNTVLAFATASTIMAVILGFVSIRFFSRRIRIINKAIAKVQTGDFRYRIPLDSTNDEIGNIAKNFNQMCDWVIEHINKVYVSELKQKDAELYALQSQIDPHFLYNTLEIIRMEALSNRDIQVSNMIEIVAQLFRNSIKGDMFVQIRDELDYSKHYLELYNMRYADRLSVEFSIDPDIFGFGILKHLLQPILENAIVHGIKPDRDDNRVTVRGYLQKETVILEISDNGRGMEPEQLDRLTKRLQLSHANANTDNIGVLNVNQRIRLAFGEAYGLEIESVKDKGSTVTFVIPAIKKEELIAHAQSFNRGR